ncbi:MAG: ABC transporter ATP-binding protein [Treponema sp.]|jgi:iron complex transport system ATP-binding protein|nr:ABC transporter ATP-binding protein [Treponema sp.]
MLEIKDLYCGYQGKDIIKGISLEAHRGEFLCIVGPNGCGKTTLLRAVSRIIPSRGVLSLDGRDLAALPRRDLARTIALLGQASELYFPYTVYDTAALGRYAHAAGLFTGLSARDRAIIDDSLMRLDLYGERDRLITELSGGQLQRVFLARTLVQDPEIILLDEPTNHLDLKHQTALLRYVSRWAKDNRKMAVGILHDLNLARYFAGRVALMNEGKIITCGSPAEALGPEILRETFGLDVGAFMRESLKKWKAPGPEGAARISQ